jgi:hypothetical protein
MELDLDISNLRQMQFTILDSKTKLLVGQTIVSAIPLEPWISGVFSVLNSSEKRFECQIHSNLDVLEDLRIDLLKFRSVGFPSYEDAIGLV